MKIIQVQTQAEAAGAQRVSDMLGEKLRQRGHDVRTVFMYRKTDVYDADPYADFVLRQRPSGLGGQLRAAWGLMGYLRRQRPDAVISFQHYGNVFGTIGGRLAGAKYIVANQSGAPEKQGIRGFVSFLDMLMGSAGLYQQNVVNSAWTEAQFEGFPSAYRRRLRRIDHGVSGPVRAYDKTEARAAFGLPRDATLVISAGRLSALKNLTILVEVLTRLPEVELAIAGAGPEREAILARAEALGVADRLHLVGEVSPSRMFEFLATGDVFAYPSRLETFGLAVAEAAVAGLPIVSSDLPVLREVLACDGGEPAALFMPPQDAARFAAAIAQVLADAPLRRRLQSAGRRLAARYAPAKMCIAYERLLA